MRSPPRVGEIWAVGGPFDERYVRIIRELSNCSVEAYEVATGRTCTLTAVDLTAPWGYRVARAAPSV
jgi:hypothetical protein